MVAGHYAFKNSWHTLNWDGFGRGLYGPHFWDDICLNMPPAYGPFSIPTVCLLLVGLSSERVFRSWFTCKVPADSSSLCLASWPE